METISLRLLQPLHILTESLYFGSIVVPRFVCHVGITV